MNKFFMLGLAGLAFAACSNEEEVGNQFPEGTGAVTVKIVSPAMTKAVEDATDVETITVTGDVTIILDAESGKQTINLKAAELAAIPDAKVTFWNVTNPTKVTVSMNEGKNSYAEDEPTDFSGNPAPIPAYGETSTITLTADTGKPNLDNDNDGTGNKSEQGAEDGDEDKTYQLYEASVQLAIPVARLEVSGIQHITGEHTAGTEGNCAYSELDIAGVYLDNVYATGNNVVYANGAFPCVSGIDPTDYSFAGAPDTGTGGRAILKDDAVPTDFLTEDGIWPETGKAYCYYFFGAKDTENLPKFKIYFDKSTAKDSSKPLPAPRYAMITKYLKDGAEIKEFTPGHIYRITSAKLSDENIIGDEGGNTLYGVEVTVTEAVWTVETITAEWAH